MTRSESTRKQKPAVKLTWKLAQAAKRLGAAIRELSTESHLPSP
jgi:hypothetical protein